MQRKNPIRVIINRFIMKNILRAAILIFTIVAAGDAASAQDQPNQNTNQVLPKIMVIPFTKDGQDIRTVLEADFNKRLAINKVKNGFDTRGFTTKDFIATLTQAKDDRIFTTNTQTDVKSMLVQFSGADIYVEVDVHIVAGANASAQVLLTAYDAATGAAYSSIVCDSREHPDVDNTTLVNVALSTPAPGANHDDEGSRWAHTAAIPCLDQFLNILQAKFTETLNKGRQAKINFVLDNGAATNFDSKIQKAGNRQLKDVIDDWLADNSFKNNIHMQGGSATALFYDDVRIPVYDSNGNNYRLNTFGRQIREFLTSKGVDADSSVKNGALYITITN
jgi:hypothetical protein